MNFDQTSNDQRKNKLKSIDLFQMSFNVFSKIFKIIKGSLL